MFRQAIKLSTYIYTICHVIYQTCQPENQWGGLRFYSEKRKVILTDEEWFVIN
jgi:hypothetical protein